MGGGRCGLLEGALADLLAVIEENHEKSQRLLASW
jgi:hypothetical protein